MNKKKFDPLRILSTLICILGLTLMILCESCKNPQNFNFNGKWKSNDAFYTLSTEWPKQDLTISLSNSHVESKKIVLKKEISTGIESKGTWRIEGDVLFFDFPSKGIGIFSNIDFSKTESFEIDYLFEDTFWGTKRSDNNKDVKFSRISKH